MHDTDKNNYFFLNREGRWPGFEWDGLDLVKDGVLRLSSLPSFSGTLPDSLKTAPVPDGPAGLAIDRYGAIYFSDPDSNLVWRIDACDSSVAPLPCLGGSGAQDAQFSHPRGLLVPHGRDSLFVVDSGNHRIQVFDLGSLELVQIWGQSNPGGLPQPGSAPGQFNTPWTLADDSENNVYVVDYNNQRVQKFNAIGAVVPAFWNNMQASSQLQQPSDIAVCEQDGSVWILVLDASQAKVFVFDKNGNPVSDSAGKFQAISLSLQQPMGLAAAGDSFYIGDNDQRRIFRFQFGEKVGLVGEALGYEGPVAALLLDGKGGLLVHPGSGARPVLLQAQGGCRAQGVLWNTCPIRVENRKVTWHRLQALLESLKKNAHLDLFAYSTCKENDAPKITLGDVNPFADPKWKSANYPPDQNITDLYIGGKEAKYLWLGALFLSDGSTSPVLKQLRVEFDYPTYDQFLPAIYRNQANCGEFLLRLLSLFESFNQEVEDEIAGIATLFDPQAVPTKFLAWLAGCLGLDLDQNWDEQKQRRIIAEIFRLSGRRGTAAGLRSMLRIFAGVDVVIEEPILHASWWALPASADSCCESCASHAAAASEWQGGGDSILGWTTMLAPAQPQGAVVGFSSDLDQSHLITDDDFGAPLFVDIAYRFIVNVYRGQVMCQGVLERIRAVLDQEKPAHTVYELCIIEPRFRVGFQGRIGIDTVVAGQQRSLVLEDDSQLLGEGTLLGGQPASYVGMETRLGVTTRLS